MKTSHDRDRRCCSLAVEGPDEPVLQYRGVALGWGRAGMGSYLIDSWEVIGTLKEGAPQELEPVPRPAPISLSLLSAMSWVAMFIICSRRHILPHHCPVVIQPSDHRLKPLKA